jgi:hypothetical protein
MFVWWSSGSLRNFFNQGIRWRRGEWSVSRPGRFNHREKSPRKSLRMGLCGPQNQSGRLGEEKNVLSCRSVGTMTWQRAGRSGVRIPAGTSESSPKRPDQLWGPPSLIFNGYPVLAWGKSGRVVKFTTHLQLVPRLGSRAISLLPLYDFVAWTGKTLLYYPFDRFFLWLDSPIWAWASSFRRGFTITHIWLHHSR